MSLINDALRRASQSEKDRPRKISTPRGLEPAPATQTSRFSLLLGVVVVLVLMLACWSFWQWWTTRHDLGGGTQAAANRAAPLPPRVVPPTVVVETIPAAPATPVNPAPATIVEVAPAVAAPSVTPPSKPSAVGQDNQIAWPLELKLGGLFYSKTNARVVINGNLYQVGDNIQGVVLKKIEKNKVTVEWNGHSKVLMMDGP